MRSRRSLELFSGAGGLALGLEQAGWRHVALVEKNSDACSTIRLNISLGHPLAKCWTLCADDVRAIRYSDLVCDSVDMIAGGPPCQPFSLGGKHRAHQDRRDMFPEAVRAVRELSPTCFVFENVKGLLRQSFSSYFNYIVLQLTYPQVAKEKNEPWESHLGRLERLHTANRYDGLIYRVVYRLLNAADYGVPQQRHRVFLVGFRSDIGREWSFPEATHSQDRLLWDQWVSGEYWDEHRISKKQRPPLSPCYAKCVERLACDLFKTPPPGERWRTVRDALIDLPCPSRGRSNVSNHEFHSGAKPYAGHTGSPLDEPSKTLKAGDHGVPGGENMISLPDGSCRYYTVRESARVQTFPDDYILAGSWMEAMRQVGNAVPVKLATIVGMSVLKQAT